MDRNREIWLFEEGGGGDIFIVSYIAHSSASSASEMKGSSIALIARSPQRMLFRKGFHVRKTTMANLHHRVRNGDLPLASNQSVQFASLFLSPAASSDLRL